jgi:hypothetical protein
MKVEFLDLKKQLPSIKGAVAEAIPEFLIAHVHPRREVESFESSGRLSANRLGGGGCNRTRSHWLSKLWCGSEGKMTK